MRINGVDLTLDEVEWVAESGVVTDDEFTDLIRIALGFFPNKQPEAQEGTGQEEDQKCPCDDCSPLAAMDKTSSAYKMARSVYNEIRELQEKGHSDISVSVRSER